MPTESDQPPAPISSSSIDLRAMPADPRQPAESRIGDRLRHVRSQLDMSIEAVARLTKDYEGGAGVSPASISRYEAGESLPGARELRILCDAFGVPVEWLLYGRLNNSGATKEEQELLRSLDAFVRRTQTDASVGGTTVSGILDQHSRQEATARAAERDERIARAKRPGAT